MFQQGMGFLLPGLINTRGSVVLGHYLQLVQLLALLQLLVLVLVI
jgi:hypothetical protein